MDKRLQTQVTAEPVGLDDPKSIAIFGGSFNPIHNGQLIAAEQVANQLKVDRLLFMPNAISSDATKTGAVAPSHRANMVNLAIRGNTKFFLETIELQHGYGEDSYLTIQELKEANPNKELYWVMGASRYKDFGSWEHSADIAANINLVGIEEPNIEKNKDFEIQWISIPYLNITSNDVRSHLRTKRSVRYLVPDMVAAYIAEYNLYIGK